jgi:hypothetical protein
MEVPNMSRYTDKRFGFSLWYPAAWKILDEPVVDATRGGWFPDAKIVKQLRIRNPAKAPTGVIVEEVEAPAGLTELGRSKSPSPVGIDERYFFDSKLQQWMCAQLSALPDGTRPTTAPVNVLRRTMGGLPMFLGAVRGGNEVLVPLDETHFLAILGLDVDSSHMYLAETVMATNPDAGKPANAQVQRETIQREAVELANVE